MTVPTNAVQTYDRTAIRESLSDVIYDISPTDTPFMTNIGKGGIRNIYFEWQTDTLTAADADNKAIQGDDVTGDAADPTVRIGNYTQLMDKVIIVSSTAEAVDHAGMRSQMAYQTAKRSRELKRDMEMRACGNYASVAGDAGTESETGGAAAWLETNVSFPGDGSAGGFSAGIVGAATEGTPRTFTEALLKTVLASCWDNGGEPTMVLVGSSLKQTASTFDGIATQYRDHGANNRDQAIIIGAADVYVHDFGIVNIVPSRFVDASIALVLDPEMWSMEYLQSFRSEPLAKTGHATKKLLSVEWGLRCNNEAGNGGVYALS